MSNNEKQYDFSNEKSYDGRQPKNGEVLVPFLADEILENYHNDVRAGLRSRNDGLLEANFKTWSLRGRKIKVGFTVIPKDEMDAYMTRFWKAKDKYMEATRKARCLIANGKGELVRCPKYNKCEGCTRPDKEQFYSRTISLDKAMEDNEDDDTGKNGFEPQASDDVEGTVVMLDMVKDLIQKVSEVHPEAAAILPALMEDPSITEALAKVGMLDDRRKGYHLVKKIRRCAKQLYEENYR